MIVPIFNLIQHEKKRLKGKQNIETATPSVVAFICCICATSCSQKLHIQDGRLASAYSPPFHFGKEAFQRDERVLFPKCSVSSSWF